MVSGALSVSSVGGPVLPRAESLIFGRAAILRSLVVFNALFAVQTLLDVVYLWGGVRLPDGLSYADYAHRGAYPLIATALLVPALSNQLRAVAGWLDKAEAWLTQASARRVPG